MASATNYFNAYQSAQHAIVALKMSILEIVDGHRDGIEPCDISRLLGMYQGPKGCSPSDIVDSILGIMESEGTLKKVDKKWQVVDIT